MEAHAELKNVATAPDKSLLIVDDDKVFCDRLARAMSSRGFETSTASGVADAMASLSAATPSFAVIDLKLAD